MFEDTFLFTDTVAANIAFADPGPPSSGWSGRARLAGADEFIAELPDGYDTLLGERGFSLSGGQRQRIALARAILAEPRSPRSSTMRRRRSTRRRNTRSATRCAQVMAGRTTIVIAHRPATIALAERVVLLDERTDRR